MNRSSYLRRYDLDALRATAMLLGIVLHAGLSFTPFPWAVQDEAAKRFLLVVYSLQSTASACRTSSSTSPDWTHGVDDVLRGKIAPCRDNSLTRGTTALLGADCAAFCHDGWSPSAVNGTIDATAAHESLVSSVDD